MKAPVFKLVSGTKTALFFKKTAVPCVSQLSYSTYETVNSITNSSYI